MENRKPFEIKKILIVYNFLQVLFNVWIFYEACVCGWLTGYSYRCEPVDYSTSYWAVRVNLFNLFNYSIFILYYLFSQAAKGCWWYYINKFTDFFDTLFFIMRKRYDQVTTLHVVHHGIMPFSRNCIILILNCPFSFSISS